MDFRSEGNFELTKLLMKMIDNIKELQTETVKARGKIVSVADKLESRNWESDIFSNLSDDYSDSDLYQQLVEQIYYGKDPLDSEEWTAELSAIAKAAKNNE